MLELMRPEGEKLFTVTDVTPSEIFGLSTLMCYANVFKSNVISKWIHNFLLLRISRLRMGRREFLLLSTGIKEIAEEKKRGVKKVTDLFSGLR